MGRPTIRKEYTCLYKTMNDDGAAYRQMHGKWKNSVDALVATQTLVQKDDAENAVTEFMAFETHSTNRRQKVA